MSALFEKATDELRQVTEEITFDTEHTIPQTVSVVVRVQRKWFVQSGDSYRADRARAATDRQTGSWHPLEPNVGFLWTPVRSEWRDLRTVTEADVAAELSTNA